MSAAAFKEAGNKHLQAKQFDEAIQAYSEAIKINPNDHVFFSNRSAAYLSKGDAENALHDAEQCVKISPQWAKGYSRKGAALHSLRRYDEGEEAYREGLAIAPSDDGLKSGLNEIQKAKESTGPGANPLGGLFGPQMLAKLAGHPKFAAKLSDPTFKMKLQLAQQNPQYIMQDPEMMEVLQVILGIGEDGNGPSPFSAPPTAHSEPPRPTPTSAPKKQPEPEFYEEMNLSEEERVAKRKRDDSAAKKERGNTLYKAKQFEEAIAAYDEAYAADASNLMVLNNKAAVYIEQGEVDRAIEVCNEVLEKASSAKLTFDDRAKVYQRIAAAHLKRNDYANAIHAYGKSQMEKFDKNVERKLKTLELEQRKLAVQQYINPELGLEAKERGNAAFREGKFPDAIKEYEEACKRDPKNAAYHNNLAAAYQKMLLFNDAKREVELSLELDRNYVKAWAKKGDIEFFLKEYHKSMDSYKAGLQIEPDNSLCKAGLQKTVAKIQEANMEGGVDKERTAHAMADPEIQAILMDPTIRQVLTDFQENPKFAQKAMTNDANIRAKIEKLIAAGVLQVK